MKPLGETLCFERSSTTGDEAVAGLLKTDLKHKSVNPYNQDDEERMALHDKLEEWLKDGVIQELLPLTIDEVDICIDIIKRKIGVASETAETWTVNNIRLADGLLPKMEEFAEEQKPASV